MLARKYGLACDRVLQVEMVDYEGNIFVANQSTNSDLLWASKGGGGGNFGIVTHFTLSVRLLLLPQAIFNIVLYIVHQERHMHAPG